MNVISSDQPRVLVVDDEKFIRDILADFLTMEGYAVRTAEDGAQALSELSHSSFDLIISDLKMPKMGGLDLLQHVGQLQPEALTVIMTGFGTVETAIDAMKQGAYDYILKPFKVEEIVHVVQRGLEKKRLATENLRLREALSLYKVSEAITASLSLDDVVSTVTRSALHEVDADAVFMWLGDGEGGYFERLRQTREFAGAPFEPGRLDPTAVQARIHQDAPLVLHAQDALPLFAELPTLRPSGPGSLAPGSLGAGSLGAGSLGAGSLGAGSLAPGSFGHFGQGQIGQGVVSTLTIPLRMQTRLLGWISVLSCTPSKRFTEGQRKLLSIIASRAAAAIENAHLYEDLQATFQQTIQSLANTIDKMDHYTAGHSQRVALYASRLARWLGLEQREIEIVRQAALMHDIGKVGCVMNLNKPGKLSAEEYESFQLHPGYGKEILDPIAFLQPVIPGVHLHHERWDGRGYPLRLAGNNIPLIARIISVADTYDAMTSNRAYRRALPHEVTVGEIERCSGTQFDPDVAGPFVERIDQLREQLTADGQSVPE